MIRRFIVILFILTLANVYVGGSLYLATGFSGVGWICAVVFLFELLMPVLRFKGEGWRRSLPVTAPLIWGVGVLSMLALGVFSMVFFFSVIRDLSLFGVGFFVSKLEGETLSKISIQIELGLTILLVGVGLYQALIGPGLKRVTVPLKGLPRAFEGFRIVQVSDLHIGPTIGKAYVQKVVQAVNALKADMIALTGDITDGSPTELRAAAQGLSEMQSTFGRFFVTGNHEYYHDAPGWIALHKTLGTHVLINESYMINKGGSCLAILGVPDVTAHHFVPTHVSSPEKAARAVPTDVVKILLAHQPISYKAAEPAGVSLQLSGHTHSGQFFPWNMVIGFFHKYYRGLGRFKDMWIYVNPGTGYWGPPLRTAVSSEITLLTLTRSEVKAPSPTNAT